MVIDTSAIIAVLLNEVANIARAIGSGSLQLLSAANLLEASMVIESRKGEAGGRELDLLLYRAAIEVVAVDQDQAEIAGSPGENMEKAGIRPRSITPTALPILWQRLVGCHCCSRATTSRLPTSSGYQCQ